MTKNPLPDYLQKVTIRYDSGDSITTYYNRVNVPNPRDAANYWLDGPFYVEVNNDFIARWATSVAIDGVLYKPKKSI